MSGASARSDAALLSAAKAQRVIPLFYESDAARATDAVLGLAEGGARLIEFTLRGARAERVLAQLIERAPAGVAIGAGSVADVTTAHMALDAGAAFLVGPNGDARIAELCSPQGVAYVPGTLTPTEIVTALAWGSAMVKVFPVAAVGGAAYVHALRGPLPGLQVMATGGVTAADVPAYLRAGVVCVGMGGELVRKDWVRSGDVTALAAAMRSILAAARDASE